MTRRGFAQFNSYSTVCIFAAMAAGAPNSLAGQQIARLTFNGAVGVLKHSADPGAQVAPALLLGVAYELEDWVRLDVEFFGASTDGTVACSELRPDECEARDSPSYLATLLYGLRLERPVFGPLRLFGGIHRGLEFAGRYGVFEVLAGAELPLTRGWSGRLEYRHRWDERYTIRPNPRAHAWLIGITHYP